MAAQPMLAAAAVALVALTGCGRADPEPPDPTPSRFPVTSTPSVDEVDATDPAHPVTAQEYAEAAVAAWAAPDLLRLAELATDDVHDYIVELPGPPDLTWTFIRCEERESTSPARPASSTCSFHNLDGDFLLVTVDHGLLGEPEAVVETEFEATAYPEGGKEYVTAFVTAWQDGNLARMDALAVPDAAEVFHQLPPEPEVDYQIGKPDDGIVEVVVVLAEVEVQVEVNTGLYGDSQAIRTAVVRDV